MILDDHRHGCGNIKRFAYAHYRPSQQHRSKVLGESGAKGCHRPDGETQKDCATPPEPIGHESCKETAKRIDPKKYGRKQSEIGVANVEISLDRLAHRDDELPIEIIQHRYKP